MIPKKLIMVEKLNFLFLPLPQDVKILSFNHCHLMLLFIITKLPY